MMRAWVHILCACLLGIGGQALVPRHSVGAEPPRLKKELQAIRAVIEENFRTSNNEDLPGCMATMTPHMPYRDELVAQLKQFFEATDVYIRLVDLQFVSAEMSDYGPAATVRLTQKTFTKTDEEDPPNAES